jgi:hypothetical protein
MKRSLLAATAAAVIVIGGVGTYAYQASAAQRTDGLTPAQTVAATANDSAVLDAADTMAPIGPDGLPSPGPNGGRRGPGGPGWRQGAWGHDGGHGWDGDRRGFHGPRMAALRNFGLFARVQNKNLTESDVKVIAQALLLEHGNHDWKVADVSTGADKAIDFAFTTAHGDVVAKFAVDPATGHLKRIG